MSDHFGTLCSKGLNYSCIEKSHNPQEYAQDGFVEFLGQSICRALVYGCFRIASNRTLCVCVRSATA